MIFYDAAADGSNGIIQATAVRVQFAAATPAPRILEVTTSPRLRTLEGGFWLELPQGEGTVVFSVKATHAQRVRFVLTPTGTETAPYAKLLGEDRTPDDGFTLVWRYPGRGPVRAPGRSGHRPGGTSDKTCSASPTNDSRISDRRHDQPVAPVALRSLTTTAVAYLQRTGLRDQLVY